MFQCFPIQSKEEQREVCARLGAEFRIDDLAYRVWIDEEEAGVITFCIKGKKGCLRQICFRKEKEDFEVMFICGRACMNFMDSVGATEGYFLSPSENQERLVQALGYQKQPDGSYYLNTEGFFIEHCKKHEEKPFE